MEPTDALRSIETALRLAVVAILGDNDWLSAAGAPEEVKLRERQTEESRRRDGAIASSNLIDYTETYHLTNLIMKNWDNFQEIFRDKKRTESFFGVIADVRNNIAHSRDLVPFERDLISGIAGMIRNQVSIFRSSRNQSSAYYPLIERLTDSFGNDIMAILRPNSCLGRVEVGDSISLEGAAFNSKGKTVKWQLFRYDNIPDFSNVLSSAIGDSVRLEYTFTRDDIGEHCVFYLQIVADSQYHRHGVSDDGLTFQYSVNPPDE